MLLRLHPEQPSIRIFVRAYRLVLYALTVELADS